MATQSSRTQNRRHNRTKTPDKSLDLAKVQRAIDDKAHQSSNSDLRFVCDYDLETILKQHESIVFGFEEWDGAQKAQIMAQCPQLIGILVVIDAFSKIDSVKALFYGRGTSAFSAPCLNDGHLLIDPTAYTEPQQQFMELLPYALRRPFLDTQYILRPHKLEEQDPNKTVHLDPRGRLPYMEVESHIGVGGYSEVSKVVVPKRYFKTVNNHRNIRNTNEEPRVFALKHISGAAEFLEEVANNEIIKESLTYHTRILQHHISYIRGNSFNILLPLAEHGNLEVFLNEGEDPFNTRGCYNFAAKFPKFSRTGRGTPSELLTQFAYITDAVWWLHDKIRLINPKNKVPVHLVHLDLKPDNILIRASRDSVVGLWVLSDFGISAKKEGKDHNPEQNILTVRDAYNRISRRATSRTKADQSLTRPRRAEGTYQAPEVECGLPVGRKSDVWSLACIFNDVLAFSLGSRALLSKCREERVLRRRYGTDDYFYSEKPDKRLQAPEPSDFEVRPAVTAWLNSLMMNGTPYENWVKRCAKIIQDTLVIDMAKRPGAETFNDQVTNISVLYDDVSEVVSSRPSSAAAAPPPTSDALSPVLSSSRSLSQASTENPRVSVTSTPASDSISLARSKSSSWRVNKSTEETEFGEKCKAIKGSICSSGRYVAWIVRDPKKQSHIRVAPVFAETTNLTRRYIPLPDNMDWKQVEIAGQYVAAFGCKYKARNDWNVSLFNLQYSDQPLDMPNFHHEFHVQKIAMSPSGLVALMGHDIVVLLTLRPRAALYVRQLPSAEDHQFRHTAFSSSGGTLLAWSLGKNQIEAFYCWRNVIDKSMEPDLYRFSAALSLSNDLDIFSLTAPHTSLADRPIDRLIFHRGGSFHDVRSNGSGEMKTRYSFPMDPYLLADMNKDHYLVRVTRVKGKYRVSLLIEPFRHGGKSRGEQSYEFSVKDQALLCQTRVATYDNSVIIVVLMLDGKFLRIKIDPPEDARGA